jgi:hypothetical protein
MIDAIAAVKKSPPAMMAIFLFVCIFLDLRTRYTLFNSPDKQGELPGYSHRVFIFLQVDLPSMD